MADEKPFFSFDGLTKLLTSMGYQVEKATGYREVANVDVDLNELKNNMEFSNDGIFLIDPNDGSKQQIFLYKCPVFLLAVKIGTGVVRNHTIFKRNRKILVIQIVQKDTGDI